MKANLFNQQQEHTKIYNQMIADFANHRNQEAFKKASKIEKSLVLTEDQLNDVKHVLKRTNEFKHAIDDGVMYE